MEQLDMLEEIINALLKDKRISEEEHKKMKSHIDSAYYALEEAPEGYDCEPIINEGWD